MGRKIDSTIFHRVKYLQKSGKSTREIAESVHISTDSVNKIKNVGTYDMYLHRYVLPKRRGGKSYEQYKREAASKLNRKPVNEREKVLKHRKNADKSDNKSTGGITMHSIHLDLQALRERERERELKGIIKGLSVALTIILTIVLAVAVAIIIYFWRNYVA